MGYDFHYFFSYPNDALREEYVNDVIKILDKSVYNKIIQAGFNGLSVVEPWNDVNNGFKIGFAIDDSGSKKLVHYCFIDSYGGWQPYLGICSADYAGTQPPYTDGLTVINESNTWSQNAKWKDRFSSQTTGVSAHVIVDNETNEIINISASEIGNDLPQGLSGNGHDCSILIDRPKEKVYAPRNAVSSYNIISNLNGDLSSIGTFIIPTRTSYNQNYMVEQDVMYKDLFNNPVKYDGSIPLKSFNNYEWSNYYLPRSQRIQTEDNETYIHIGEDNLFIPFDNYYIHT